MYAKKQAEVVQDILRLEYEMTMLYQQLKGAANVYMMDYRGTGLSTFLDCAAAQVITSGTPRGKSMDPSEVPSCAQALEDKYGDLASFSTTSAAKDLVTLISELSNGEHTSCTVPAMADISRARYAPLPSPCHWIRFGWGCVYYNGAS
ncbi:hypothetical protein PC116_g28320 [Phytophthora cactorum]|nr:hypothetical protein PC116_g28320 [Phytophthora cactorum]